MPNRVTDGDIQWIVLCNSNWYVYVVYFQIMVWKINETMAAVPLPSIYEWGAATLYSLYYNTRFMYTTCVHTIFLQLLARLIVRLAKHNIGYIDWSPYIAQVHHTQILFIITIYYVYMALLTLSLSLSVYITHKH